MKVLRLDFTKRTGTFHGINNNTQTIIVDPWCCDNTNDPGSPHLGFGKNKFDAFMDYILNHPEYGIKIEVIDTVVHRKI